MLCCRRCLCKSPSHSTPAMIARAGIPLVKKYEQCRLKAFIPVPGDPWTIGWGRTHNVHENDECSQDQADQWLIEEYDQAEAAVLGAVNVHLTDNQLGALTSFAYNVGTGSEGHKDGLIHLKNGGQSHLLIYTNRGDFDLAADEFPKWASAHGVLLLGLKRRRDEERALFLS